MSSTSTPNLASPAAPQRHSLLCGTAWSDRTNTADTQRITPADRSGPHLVGGHPAQQPRHRGDLRHVVAAGLALLQVLLVRVPLSGRERTEDVHRGLEPPPAARRACGTPRRPWHRRTV